MSVMPITISSNYPMHIEVDARRFGEIFASLSCEEQVTVFRSMVDSMRPHSLQWDYIAIELERPENKDILDELRAVLLADSEVI